MFSSPARFHFTIQVRNDVIREYWIFLYYISSSKCNFKYMHSSSGMTSQNAHLGPELAHVYSAGTFVAALATTGGGVMQT
jgi:hypothetical protein